LASGNNFDPDPITLYRYFDSAGNVVDGHAESPHWLDNAGMQLPTASADYSFAKPDDPHIDAYVNCTLGASYSGYFFIWYTKPQHAGTTMRRRLCSPLVRLQSAAWSSLITCAITDARSLTVFLGGSRDVRFTP